MAWGHREEGETKETSWGHPKMGGDIPPNSTAAEHGEGFLKDRWEMEVQRGSE